MIVTAGFKRPKFVNQRLHEIRRKYTAIRRSGPDLIVSITVNGQVFDLAYSGTSTEGEIIRDQLAKALLGMMEGESEK
jgi:hypothetical protein